MKISTRKRNIIILFGVSLLIILAVFVASGIKTDTYNPHTVRGGAILNKFKSLPNVGEGAHYHHERYDGSGYPEGKAGEDILLDLIRNGKIQCGA